MDNVVNLMGEETAQSNVRLAKEGDKVAFEALINENRLSLYRVSKGILKNEEDAADAIQETIIKAYRGIRRLKKEEYFKTWLIKILINECNAVLRAKSKLIVMEKVLNEEEKYMDTYFNSEVLTAVSLLEEELRIVVLLFYYEDLSVKAIAAILRIPEGTVKSRLSRARTKLGEYLREGGIINE